MKKKIIVIGLLLAMLLGLAGGCGEEKKEDEYWIYYLNADVTKLVPQKEEIKNMEGEELVKELLEKLGTPPDDAALRQTIPSDVEVRNVSISSYQITVDFSREYYEMEPTEEILTRAAIVKTLLQITDYPYVMFTVESMPLTNSNGTNVGAMSQDSFVENPGEQINSSQKTTLTLYFSNAKGDMLVPETREVHYSSNISMEKLVMEQLMEGSKNADLLSTIPTGTKLITISVVDAVCYVNLDEMFLNQNKEISEQVVLFSIVDSLTELSSVEKVQVSINGDTSGKCRYSYDFATMYEADMSIVENGEERIDSTQ